MSRKSFFNQASQWFLSCRLSGEINILLQLFSINVSFQVLSMPLLRILHLRYQVEFLMLHEASATKPNFGDTTQKSQKRL